MREIVFISGLKKSRVCPIFDQSDPLFDQIGHGCLCYGDKEISTRRQVAGQGHTSSIFSRDKERVTQSTQGNQAGQLVDIWAPRQQQGSQIVNICLVNVANLTVLDQSVGTVQLNEPTCTDQLTILKHQSSIQNEHNRVSDSMNLHGAFSISEHFGPGITFAAHLDQFWPNFLSDRHN